MATTFTLFPHLITELRLEIWRAALPDPINHPLFPYQKGCWKTRVLKEGDRGYEPGDEDTYLEFDPSRLDPFQIELPMMHVNREARDVAQEYAQSNQLTRQKAGDATQFIRAFDSRMDTVFVSDAHVVDFLREPLDRMAEPDLLDRTLLLSNPILPRLALTVAGFKICKESLGEYFSTVGPIEVFYVVSIAGDESMQPRELEDDDAIKCFWRHSKGEWEVARDGRDLADRPLWQELIDGLDDELTSVPGGVDLEIHVQTPRAN